MRSLNKVLRSTIVSGILILSVGAGAGETMTESDGRSCSRELWRVLFGGGATLLAVFICMGRWQHTHLHWTQLENRSFWGFSYPPSVTVVSTALKIFAPPVCAAWILTAAYAAILLRERLKKALDQSPVSMSSVASPTTERQPGSKVIARSVAKRICPMVVWIGIDEATYKYFFIENEDADIKRTVKEFFGERRLKKAPNLKVAVPWPGRTPEPEGQQRPYDYFCTQGWDPRNSMWKEAMVATDVLPNIVDMLETIEGMPWWGAVLLVLQGLGYQVSVLSRFAQGMGVSPVEVVGVWLSVIVVLEAGIMPLFAIPSTRGISICFDKDEFHKVIQYYIKKRHGERAQQLDCVNLWSFVGCILVVFSYFLILIAPLIYYYYKLTGSILSFVSLFLSALLAGAGIVSFALMLFSPPHDVIFSFTNFPPLLKRTPNKAEQEEAQEGAPPTPNKEDEEAQGEAPQVESNKRRAVGTHWSNLLILSITLWMLLNGIASYILAIIDTTMHWHLFDARDTSFFSFIIPHIGS